MITIGLVVFPNIAPNSGGIRPSFMCIYATITFCNVLTFSSEAANFAFKLTTSSFNWELSLDSKLEELHPTPLNFVLNLNAILYKPPKPKQRTRPQWSFPNTFGKASSEEIVVELSAWLISWCYVWNAEEMLN